MAIVAARITLTVQDANGTKAATPYYLEITDTETVAQVMTELGAFATLLEAITDGKVVRQAIQMAGVPATQDTKPLAGAFVSRAGTFNFAPANNRKWGAVVPSIALAKQAGGRIDLSDADVAAFAAHIEGSAAPLQYTNPDGLSLTNFVDAFLGARKHRRAERSTSLEYE